MCIRDRLLRLCFKGERETKGILKPQISTSRLSLQTKEWTTPWSCWSRQKLVGFHFEGRHYALHWPGLPRRKQFPGLTRILLCESILGIQLKPLYRPSNWFGPESWMTEALLGVKPEVTGVHLETDYFKCALARALALNIFFPLSE